MMTNSIEKQKPRIAAEPAFNNSLSEIRAFEEIDFLDTCNKAGVFDIEFS